ncbi:MAG: hypothetical protein INR62_03250, partial [Rhodospirillales bacterium]|nr:hypothetical protein [Acetobacter sp.]
NRSREQKAEEILWRVLTGRRCPEDGELKAMRPQWEKGGTAESMARYNAFVRSAESDKWTRLAQRCGIELPAVTFTKAEVGKLLDYSLSGVERLMRVGRLGYETWGHQTVRFRPEEVRRFIKTGSKWRRSSLGK